MCMMDGIQTMLKFLLIFFNFVIFVSIFIFSELKFSTIKVKYIENIVQVVGVVVFGIAVWVIVDAPKFTELFDKARV